MTSCAVPLGRYETVVLGHGSGGLLSAQLVEEIFLPAFADDTLARLEDQATLALGPGTTRIAVTTDSFVVRPLFFPGGDIGSLAVHGTVNDLAVGGALPRWLTAAFVLEEGLPLETLRRVCASMKAACAAAGVTIVAGDTKVVEHGKGDGVFITTTGVGVVPPGRELSVRNARPGDAVIVSGTLGDHGVAILAAREGLSFETALQSDSAPLVALTAAMLEVSPRIRWMRDPTRGGLASALNELAAASHVGVVLEETALPLRDAVRAGCELLGLDPLYAACEGRLVAVVPAEDAGALLAAMRTHPDGRDAVQVGRVVSEHPRVVSMRSRVGGERVVRMLAGEQLPRIC